jgi:UDP-glucose 4-epimerase
VKQVSIVTGAYGYIGSVLTKELHELGHYVIGIDNDLSALGDWMKSSGKRRTKYCDEFLVNCFASEAALNLIHHFPEATVYHLAANSLLGPSAHEPLVYFENNTANTLKLLQCLRPTNRLVFASTAAVYAPAKNKSIKESAELGPPNNYGLSKLWCEQMIDSYHQLGYIKATSFRFFNVVGAWDNMGQQEGTPHIFNKLCESTFEGTTFQIYSNRYPTPDGTCIRDYVHVRDICGAMIHADEYMNTSTNYGCHNKYNLGTHKGHSVDEIITMFQAVTGTKINTEVVDQRIGDPAVLVANPNKFIKETKFKYKHSNSLSDMINSAWSYYNARV